MTAGRFAVTGSGLAGLALVLTGGHVALATEATTGTPGYCRSDSGVTVVVDFSDLDGHSNIVVRCVSETVSTGVQALQQAGFRPEGTRQYGLAFICRIAGRPAANEPLAVSGNPGYTEQCQRTPPNAAHWEYWTAPNGGQWQFSQSGAGGHRPIPGGFEGWSFSLNGSHSPPGINPARPAAAPSPTPSAAPTSRSTSPPPPAPPGAATSPNRPRPTRSVPTPPVPAASPNRPRPTHSVPTPPVPAASPNRPRPTHSVPTPPVPAASPSSTASTRPSATPSAPPSSPGSVSPPSAQVRGDGSGAPGAGPRHRRPPQPAPQTAVSLHPPAGTSVSGEVPPDPTAAKSAGSSKATLAGVGLLALLAAGAGITAWRRSRRV